MGISGSFVDDAAMLDLLLLPSETNLDSQLSLERSKLGALVSS